MKTELKKDRPTNPNKKKTMQNGIVCAAHTYTHTHTLIDRTSGRELIVENIK